MRNGGRRRSVRSGEEKGGKTREWRKGSREREAKGGRRRGALSANDGRRGEEEAILKGITRL